MSWKHLLLVVLLLTSACSVGVSPGPLPELPDEIPGPPPSFVPLTRLHAVRTLQATRPPRGFQVALTCRGGDRARCRRQGTEHARWLVGTLATGAQLPDGNGLRERVTTIVTAWPSPARAKRYSSTLARRLDRYQGEYYLPLRTTGPGRYTPGDRGKGEVQPVTFHRWRGVGVRRSFFHYFDHYETSGTVYGGHFVMRRGAHVADLEWVARNQATDRRLSHLPRRLLRVLG